MNSATSTYPEAHSPVAQRLEPVTVALIGRDQVRRRELAAALLQCEGTEVREYPDYPPSLADIPRLLEQRSDAIVIDLDSQPDYALQLVESICAVSSATVMVYSSKPDHDLLMRCMRAGAREFLTPPFAQKTLSDALHRAAGRRTATRLPRKTGGRLLVFLGAKGGAGVTTLACNFAVALAQESGQSTLLIDLDLPLGDAALNLGIITEYSTVNALQDAGRLDASLLHKLLTKHSSGVSVLAAPGKFPQFHATNEAIDKLMAIARQEFDNVVVDVGARLDLTDSALFRDAFTIYLVTQAGIPELRNSNRLIHQFFNMGGPKLEIVINRHEPRAMGVTDEAITKALTRAPNWKIPNDYAAVRQMQNTATPLAMGESPIAKIIRQMATAICGQRATQPKKKGFRLFG